MEYTLAGLDLLLHRIGWSVQVPSREDPAQTDAVPTRPHRLPHCQDRPRLPTAISSAIEDL
ncbi:hypothetical protein [Streptomyces sp. NPDC058964]|uniref:hypothetical protein n=1 Tax=Streptomyces sp. NPDC058964 TaxID=3346681 RepID=UPI003675242A